MVVFDVAAGTARAAYVDKISMPGEWAGKLEVFTSVEAYCNAVGDFDIMLHTHGSCYRPRQAADAPVDESIRGIHLTYNGVHYDYLRPLGEHQDMQPSHQVSKLQCHTQSCSCPGMHKWSQIL